MVGRDTENSKAEDELDDAKDVENLRNWDLGVAGSCGWHLDSNTKGWINGVK